MFRRFYKSNTKGFTMIEGLFSLIICLLIVINITSIVRILKTKNSININNSSLEIAVKQISQNLYTAKIESLGTSIIYTNENDEQFKIELNNNRIVKTPGFDIFLYNVNEVYFYEDNKKIYIDISVNDTKYTFWIGTNYQEN